MDIFTIQSTQTAWHDRNSACRHAPELQPICQSHMTRGFKIPYL